MVNITKFLEKHRIYIDIVLTIAIIWLAFSANSISMMQNNLTYKSKTPKFYVEVKTSDINDSLEERSEILEIYNKSGYFENYSSVTVCEFILYVDLPNALPKEISYFINGYYAFSYMNGSKEGLIESKLNNKAAAKLFYINKYLREIAKSLNISSCNSEFKTYLKIDYVDFFEKSVTKYFDTSHFEGRVVSDIIGKKIFNNYYKSMKNHKFVEYDDITKEFLFKIVSNTLKNNK